MSCLQLDFFCISAGDGTESDEGIEDDPLLSTTATDGGASLAYPLLPTDEGVNLVNQDAGYS